jgi:ABC-type Fe3+ transport system substrate-binding protein
LLAAADRPANPNAQRLFVNWWLTRQAQFLIVQQRRNQSLRVDVPTDLVPENWRLPDPLYIFDADPGAAKKQAIATKFVRDLIEKFGL